MYYKGSISVTITGIYLPYHKRRAEQVALFIDNNCAKSSPWWTNMVKAKPINAIKKLGKHIETPVGNL